MKKKHEHYWLYEHTVYDGRRKDEVGVHRWCKCGKHEMAFARAWGRVPKGYAPAVEGP